MNDLARIASRPGIALEVDDDFELINALCLEKGWSDGLPVVPPTESRVEAMLAHCERPWDEPIATLAPRYAPATPLKLAANAVMAGCRPEYFPVVLTAIEA
ncbi:MAG: UGSC family (seleno)protein, partial [Rhodospirillaceae bacterium]